MPAGSASPDHSSSLRQAPGTLLTIAVAGGGANFQLHQPCIKANHLKQNNGVRVASLRACAGSSSSWSSVVLQVQGWGKQLDLTGTLSIPVICR